jgi:branched-chain amino acid transport system permease protein
VKRPVGAALAAGAALVLPLVVADRYHVHLLVMAGIFVLMALGLDLVLGYLGELSLGHAAFFGIGAYTTAIVTRTFGVPFPVDLVLACVVSWAFGIVIGYPSLRLTGPYFAIVTFGFAEILRLVALNWIDVTRGPMGLPDVPGVQLLGVEFRTERQYYYLVLVLVALAILVTRLLLASPLGHAFLAIRENEELATAVGVHAFRCKLVGFGIGMAFTGAAGAVYARYVHFVDPTALGFFYTYTVVAMVIVGGRGSVLGTLIGAVLFTVLPEYLRVAETYRLPAFGLLIVLAVVFLPEGISGALRRWARREAPAHAAA